MAAPNPIFPRSPKSAAQSLEITGRREPAHYAGALIINADDFGRDRANTERIRECIRCGGISSVSAMLFMQDSERAASLAREQGIDAGLHLNLTTPFSAARAPALLSEHQERLARYLCRHRLARLIYHPSLSASFEYVVRKQLDEFRRLYGEQPGRIDGHHHMHLCANVLMARLLPAGTVVRRNFSFLPGEKSWLNRSYRSFVDRMLARRHRLTDYFYSLPPLQPAGRLERIFLLAREFVVEVETHPIHPAEHRFVAGGEMLRLAGGMPVARRFAFPGS